jgi:hypothetical protein
VESHDHGFHGEQLVGFRRIRHAIGAHSRLYWNSDNGAAMLLAITALATAWSSYQASVWGGIQSASYTRSAVLRGKAAQANEEIARGRLVDVALFTRWLEADADHKQHLRLLYEAHFRPEFRAAFERWRNSGGVEHRTTTPFDPPGYKSPRADEASRYETEAAAALDSGERANGMSDRYVFFTVTLASVLFFAGAVRPVIAPKFRTPVLFVAMLLCFWTLAQLFMAPVAR